MQDIFLDENDALKIVETIRYKSTDARGLPMYVPYGFFYTKPYPTGRLMPLPCGIEIGDFRIYVREWQ